MAKGYVDGVINLAFKPEAEQSEIEKVLNNYTFQKVFDKGEFANSENREDKFFDRLYLLTVSVGSEANVVKELPEKYSSLVEYVERSPIRKPLK